MSTRTLLTTDFAEIIDDAIFTADELARLCGVTTDWVRNHVKDEVLEVSQTSGEWRFDSLTLIRARRVVHLETAFDADPQLAALTADLIDEVLYLRRLINLTDN